MTSSSDAPQSSDSEALQTADGDAAFLMRCRRADRLARLMDDQFELPVVRWKIGLDPILGLLPVGGDWAASMAGVYILWTGIRLGAPFHVLGSMALNTTIDLVVGYVPVLGDVFDAGYKSNRQNINLLFNHFGVRRRNGRLELSDDPGNPDTGRWVRYLVGLAATLLLLLVAAVPVLLLWWLL